MEAEGCRSRASEIDRERKRRGERAGAGKKGLKPVFDISAGCLGQNRWSKNLHKKAKNETLCSAVDAKLSNWKSNEKPKEKLKSQKNRNRTIPPLPSNKIPKTDG